MKITAQIFWTLFCILVIVGAYLYAFVWVFYRTLAKWIRKNDEELSKDWERLDAITDLNHNLNGKS